MSQSLFELMEKLDLFQRIQTNFLHGLFKHSKYFKMIWRLRGFHQNYKVTHYQYNYEPCSSSKNDRVIRTKIYDLKAPYLAVVIID